MTTTGRGEHDTETRTVRPGTTAAGICIGSNVNWLVSFGVPRETAQRCTDQLVEAVRAEHGEQIAQEAAGLRGLNAALEFVARLAREAQS